MSKKNRWVYPYIVLFTYFFQLFLRTPKIGDRIMEDTAVVSLESGWRFILTQAYWIKGANLRILSNIFSAIVDPNIYISSFVDALLLVAICYLYQLFTQSKNTYVAVIATVSVLFLYKSGVNETYFYAKTLYLSATLLVLIFIYEYLKEEKKYERLYFLQIVGLFWLETVTVSMVTVCLVGIVVDLWQKKRDSKKIRLAIFALLLLVIDGLAVYLAAPARYTQTTYSLNLGVGANLFDYAANNTYIVLLLSISMVLLFDKERKTLVFIVSGLSSLFAIANMMYKLYKIVSADLTVPEPFNWHPIRIQFIDNVYYKLYIFFGTTIGTIVLFSFFAVFFLLLFYGCIKKGEKTTFIIVLTAVIQLLMYITFFYNQPRIGTMSYFLFVGVIISQVNHWDSLEKYKLKKEVLVGFIICIGFMKMWNYNIIVDLEHEIAKERIIVTDEVRIKQLMGEWDYDEIMNIPAYVVTVDGYFTGDSNEFYEMNETRRQMLLKYYRLDDRTKFNLTSYDRL